MAVVLDAVATNDFPSNGVAAGTNLDTTLLTVGSGSNRALLLLISLSNSAVTGLTAQWDALGTPQTLTQIVTVNNGGGTRSDIWGLVAPTSGNKTLRVKWTGGGSSDIAYFSLCYTGVDQTGGTTSFPHGTTQATTTNTPQVTVTSAVGNAVVGNFTSATQIGTSPTQIELYNDDTLSNINAAGQRAVGAASVLVQYSFASADVVAVVGCDVLAAGGAEFIGPDKYMQRLSEPQRPKPGLGASLQSSASSFVFTPGVVFEFIGPDKYMQALSEPQRSKPGLLAALQAAFPAFAQAAPFNENINPDKWYQRLSEPQRQKAGLGAPQQQAFAWSSFTPGAEVITVDKWYQALSEPQRQKLGLNAAAQRFFTTDTAAIPITQLMPWFMGLSEPVRQPAGLRAWLQQAYPAFDPAPFPPSMGWYEALSEPVRFLQGVTAARQAFEAFVFQPPPTNIFDNWYQPLSEPVRQKAGLLAALQQFFAIDPTLIPNPAKLETWYRQLSEPQRNRIWLLAALQEAWTGPPRLLPAPAFTAVMNAIEQFDTFLGGGTEFYVPNSGEIAVQPIGKPGEIGVVAAPQRSGETAIVPPSNVPSTGVVVGPSSGSISVRKV